ncbi:3517_t:CDS:2 [Funneliformis mosseae]|uniref:3517_t:CDS:1 n=1 Tax=Funneliformis mosseae TaxID=27381 RepID=A0A9N9HAK3_FUNMO|nr:3517_t:CDS:2 [Funneliformis mosseae]
MSQRPTTIMGASVKHSVPDESYPSIAVLCASMNAKAYRYYFSIRIQASRQAIISDLADGVSDYEIEIVRSTCKSIYANYEPTITFVVA